MAATSIADVMDGINTLTDMLTTLESRVGKLESQPSKRQTNGTKRKGRKASNGASKLSSIFNDVTPEGSKYRIVSAWYVVDGQPPYEKKFYGLRKMAKYDWGLGKLHGTFHKYTDMPSID